MSTTGYDGFRGPRVRWGRQRRMPRARARLQSNQMTGWAAFYDAYPRKRSQTRRWYNVMKQNR